MILHTDINSYKHPHSHAHIHTSATLRQSLPCLPTTTDLVEEGDGKKKNWKGHWSKWMDWRKGHLIEADMLDVRTWKQKQAAWKRENRRKRKSEFVVRSNASWQPCRSNKTAGGHVHMESHGRHFKLFGSSPSCGQSGSVISDMCLTAQLTLSCNTEEMSLFNAKKIPSFPQTVLYIQPIT